MKKGFWLRILAVVLLTTLLAACGGGTSGSSSPASPSLGAEEGTEPASGQDAQDFGEKMTYTINIRNTELQNDDDRYEYLREKFNVDFELIVCSLNDVKEKVRIWVAGGDMPEVMWTDLELPGEMKTWAENGSIQPLPDMSSYPNLQKIRDLQQMDDMLRFDGVDYFISTLRDTDSVDFLATGLFIFRKDWAKALDMYQDEYTWEEMQELARAMMENDPGGNGSGNTVGFASIASFYPGCAGLQQYSPNWNAFTVRDGKYVWGAALPETIEGIKAAKEFYDSGLIWEEQTAAQQLDGPSRFYAGQVGILHHNMWIGNIENTINGLQQTYPGEDVTELFEIMNVKSPDGTYFARETMDSWGSICFRSDLSTEKVGRFLTMLDWLASDEGIMLQRYGVEDKDYTRNGDEIEMLWDMDDNGNYITPYEVSSENLLSLAKLYEYEKGFAAYEPEGAKRIHAQVDAYLKQPNLTIAEWDYDYTGFSAPNKDKYDLASDQRNKIIELIASSSDIEADYLTWLDSQKDKSDAILQELNEGLLG